MKVTVVPDDVAEVLLGQSWEVQSGGLFKSGNRHDCPWGASAITPELGVG